MTIKAEIHKNALFPEQKIHKLLKQLWKYSLCIQHFFDHKHHKCEIKLKVFSQNWHYCHLFSLSLQNFML